jgi:hypothetical protein
MGILPLRDKTTLIVFLKGIPFSKATSNDWNLKEKDKELKQDNITYLCRDTPIP